MLMELLLYLVKKKERVPPNVYVALFNSQLSDSGAYSNPLNEPTKKKGKRCQIFRRIIKKQDEKISHTRAKYSCAIC